MKQFYLSLLPLFLFGQIHAQTKDSIATQQIEEVRVTATAKPSTTLSSTPLQVLSDTDINKIGIQSISDAIRRFTGVVVKDYGGLGGFKAIAIRGNGAEHTAVLYDGLAVSNTQSGQIDVGQFSLDNVDMLSLNIGQSDNIFRTARSIASVGVLDIETKTPQLTDKNYQAQVQLKGGSWGYFSPYIYYAHKLSDKFSLSADGSWQRSDGHYSFERENGSMVSKGKRKNTDIDMKRTEINLFGNLGTGQTLRAKVYYFDSERGLPGSVILQGSQVLENGGKERLWDKNVFGQVRYTNKLSERFDLQMQGKYAHSYTKYTDEDPKYPDGGKQENRYNQNEYYMAGTLLYTLSDAISFSVSEDFSYNTLRANFKDFVDPERYSLLSAISGKYENKKLTVVGSLLGTYISENVKLGNSPDDRKKLSPALSLSYRPFEKTNLRIRASYKNIFRVPTFNDLYYKRMGNTSLVPERTQQYNLGTTWTNVFSDLFSYFNFSADFFYNTVKDKIIVFPTSFEPRMKNLGEVRITGFSLSSNAYFDLTEKIQLQVSGNYTYQKAIDITNSEDKNYKEQIPFTPLHSGAASVSIENPWLNFGYSLVAKGKSYNDYQNIARNQIDAYVDHSISLNKTLRIHTFRVRIQADITNLTNKFYYVIMDYPMPGRAYRLSVSMNF